MAKRKSSKQRLWLRVLMAVAALYVIASFGVAWFFTTPWRFGGDFVLQEFEKLEITTADHVPLVARYSGTGDRPVVILAHDFHDTSAQFKDMARQLAQRGLDILVFDFRGHGNSGSGRVGLGSTEVQDVEAVLQRVKRDRAGKPLQIAWLGVGTGAAAFLLAPSAGEVDCAVLVKCYDDLEQSFDRSLRASLHVGLRPLCSLAIALAQWRTGTELKTLNPLGRLAQLQDLPLLFIHDNTDREVGERLFEAAGEDAEIFPYPVDNAEFRKMSRDGALTTTIATFLTRWL